MKLLRQHLGDHAVRAFLERFAGLIHFVLTGFDRLRFCVESMLLNNNSSVDSFLFRQKIRCWRLSILNGCTPASCAMAAWMLPANAGGEGNALTDSAAPSGSTLNKRNLSNSPGSPRRQQVSKNYGNSSTLPCPLNIGKPADSYSSSTRLATIATSKLALRALMLPSGSFLRLAIVPERGVFEILKCAGE